MIQEIYKKNKGRMVTKEIIDKKIKVPGLKNKKILLTEAYEITDIVGDEAKIDIRPKKIKKSKKLITGYAASAFTSDPVKMYLRVIGNVRLLTAAEEIQLAKRISSIRTMQHERNRVLQKRLPNLRRKLRRVEL